MKREHNLIKESFFEKDNKLFTKVNCTIQVPIRFRERGLAHIGKQVYVYGMFALITEDERYTVCNITGLVPILPDKYVKVKVDGTEYLEFSFEANSCVINNLDVVQNEGLIFNIIDEFVFKGKVPWYFSYDDLGKFMDSAAKHAGASVGSSPETIELIACVICRDANSLHTNYRHVLETPVDLKKPYAYIPMMNVVYGASGNLNKITGAYASDGLVTALISEPVAPSVVERALRR